MKASEKSKLLRILKLHANLLMQYVKDPEWQIKYYYLPLAGQLRVLLCDKKLPLLLTYAYEMGIDLKIFDPSPDIMFDPILAINFQECSWDSLRTNNSIPIKKYLDKKIGAVPIKVNGKNTGSTYSPRQLINWIANKEGIAHLDFKEPQTLTSLKNIHFQSGNTVIENIIVQKKIYELAKWALIAINSLLENESLNEFQKQNEIVFKNCKIIRIETLKRFAHYKLYQQKNSYFEGEHAFSIKSISPPETFEFSVNCIIKIIPQLHNGVRTIIDIIDSTDRMIYSLFLEEEKLLKLSLGEKTYTIVDLQAWEIFNKYFNLSIEIDFLNKKINNYINCNNISSAIIQSDIKSLKIKDLFIGSSNEQNDGASLFLKELIFLNQVLNEKQRKALLKYYCKTIN